MEAEKHKCNFCGATSDQVVLLSMESKGQPDWVCVKCLPLLIHG